MNNKSNLKTVLVTGDITIDWNIARNQYIDSPKANAWDADVYTRAFPQLGGATLMADILEKVAQNLSKSGKPKFDIVHHRIQSTKVKPDNKNLNHAYGIWSPFEDDSSKTGDKKKVWRIREYLGISRADTPVTNTPPATKANSASANPSIIILDDANLGFRDNENLWPEALFDPHDKKVILKIASPITNSHLLEKILVKCPQKLTVVMTAEDLRRSHIDISKGISWERTAQELLWEFTHNPVLIRLSGCANIVISFQTSGAVLLSAKVSKDNKKTEEKTATLFFDPDANEGRWGQKHPGGVIGYTSCLTAAIAREFMFDYEKPDLSFAVQYGISAMRLLKTQGYGEIGKTGPVFPIAGVAAKFGGPATFLGVASFKVPDAKDGDPAEFQTILKNRYENQMETVAKEIVWKGLGKVISGVPVCRFNDLVAIDRREIESFNNIHSLISEYFQGSNAKPISFAVFGQPGSGKSFSITQMAESIAKNQMKGITFNLSQFTGVKDLTDAFHQVRDISLTGKLPLVFWDEFDTTLDGAELGWLRYFLAPMQDGTFQDGQITHPIGRSVFVFAGGTCSTMDDFKDVLGKDDDKKSKQAKLPDFLSRLKGYLNIIGVNPNAEKDQTYIIRRAIALRSILERSANQIISVKNQEKVADIDEAVLNAFLCTEKYTHGIRSMESIVAMSQLTNKTSFEKSYLPDETQLEIHVNTDNFVSILQRMVLDPVMIEKMAPEMHRIYCETLSSQGYTPGKPSKEFPKNMENLVAYEELPLDRKVQNKELARDIPHKLTLKEYVLLPASSGKTCYEFTMEELESLSINEHQRWMCEKLAKGYTKGDDRDRMQNPNLIEWAELSDDVKEWDRALIRGIPGILTNHGYVMVKKNKI
jgi:hypothetical protein